MILFFFIWCHGPKVCCNYLSPLPPSTFTLHCDGQKRAKSPELFPPGASIFVHFLDFTESGALSHLSRPRLICSPLPPGEQGPAVLQYHTVLLSEALTGPPPSTPAQQLFLVNNRESGERLLHSVVQQLQRTGGTSNRQRGQQSESSGPHSLPSVTSTLADTQQSLITKDLMHPAHKLFPPTPLERETGQTNLKLTGWEKASFLKL